MLKEESWAHSAVLNRLPNPLWKQNHQDHYRKTFRIIGCVLSFLSNGVTFVNGEASTFISLFTNWIAVSQGDHDGHGPRGGEVDQQAVSQSHHAGEGGVYLGEALKNAATSAVIDVGKNDSDDEVCVATAVREEDSNIWVSSDERSVDVGQVVARGKLQLQLHTMFVKVYEGKM
jgi:hypothetical protein